MCSVNDPRILNAYIAITEDEPTDWLLLGYKDSRDVISLYACGEHGLSEFRDHITNEILFGFVRIEDKFILITYVPNSISGVRRARALVHSRTVAGILELSHAQIIASSLSDLSDNNIRTRLKLEHGTRPKSRSSFHQQQRRRQSGSSYYSPSPSPVTYITDDEDDRMSATPTPSTPTSSVYSENNQNTYFTEPTVLTSQPFLVDEPKRLQDSAEAMLQQQLAKKKEMEEARFRLFQKEQKPNIAKRIEEEQKRLKQQQQQQQKEIPKWQLELQQRKLKKQESLMTDSKKGSTSMRIDTVNLHQHSLPVSLKSVKTPVGNKDFLREPIKEPQPLKELRSIKQPSKEPQPAKEPQPLKELRPVKESQQEPQPVKEPQPMIALRPINELQTVKEHSIEEPVKEVAQQTTNQQVTPEKALQNHVIKEALTENQVEALKIQEQPKPIKTLVPLMTGFVSVQVNQVPFWKRRYYTLTTQTLSFYKDELSKASLYEIDLKSTERVSLIDEDEEVFVPNSFMIETKERELFQVLADDKKQYKQLYTTLKQSV